MHELSVTESILEIALRHAEQAGGCRISKLHLVLGDLATIVDDSVQFYWDIISQGTIAEGAVMSFERIPARIRCLDCESDYTPEPGTLECPLCQGVHLKIIRGEEFYLSAIDIEKSAP